ncbi:mannose-1-phosphate guanylyltransferase/mannose-6-phosphate isomerase [Magnetococcales bacterium HHB-1]
MFPVILSGGAGTRLWPLSRRAYPKQFLSLTKEKTLFQQAVERLQGLEALQPPLIICNQEHRFLTAEQLQLIDIQPEAIFLEPFGRNTAPATACAAFHLVEKHAPESLMFLLPADHLIPEQKAFHDACGEAKKMAQQGYLTTFGVTPHTPETGYGYIQRGETLDGGFKVKRFVEKPNQSTAEKYLMSGDFYWNSGMFLFRADRFLEELQKFRPDIFAATKKAYENGQADLDFMRLDHNAFADCPSESIDYAVMEKTQDAAMTPLDAGWSDVGSWSALWVTGEKDDQGNVCYGDVETQETANCYLRAESRMLSTVGLSEMIVVETADAVLVAPKSHAQSISALTKRLKAQDREDFLVHHPRVLRPWGAFENIDQAERFKVKRITVAPGAVLSLQHHHHRAEHWVVVRGTAKVTKGDKTFLLSEDQSTYIPLGVKHRLENPGQIPLEVIEVQTGGYLEEDDIVRYEDRYGREDKK